MPVQYFMEYVSKETCIVINYSFRPKKSIIFRDINTHSIVTPFFLLLQTGIKSVAKTVFFPFNFQYMHLFPTLSLAAHYYSDEGLSDRIWIVIFCESL